MNYGFDEQPSRLSRGIGVLVGIVTGAIAGTAAFMLTMAIATMLADAFPGLHGTGLLVLYLVFLCVPGLAFMNLSRTRHASLGARTMGIVGVVMVVLLFAGDVTGTVSLYPHHVHFYITPGEYGKPDKHPSR